VARPATGEVVASFSPADGPEVEQLLARAQRAGGELGRAEPAERAAWLVRLAELLEAELPVWARQLAEEVGKPFPAAKGEVARSAALLRVLAETAVDHGRRDAAADPGRAVWTQSLGVVLAVVPAVDPLWEGVRAVGSALAGGNSVLLKPASVTAQLGLALARMASEAGLPDGAVQAVLLDPAALPELLGDARVAGVVGAGDPGAIRAVRRATADRGVPVRMEAVGCDPVLLRASGDLERAVAVAAEGCLQHSGQGALAPHRIVAPRARCTELAEQLVAELDRLPVGDPLDLTSAVGPLRSRRGVEELAAGVAEIVSAGGRLLRGGEPLPGPGFFYPPTLVWVEDPAAWAPTRPLRGPVLVIQAADTDEQAWELAVRGLPSLGLALVSAEEADLAAALVRCPVAYLGVNHAPGPAAGLAAAEAGLGGMGASGWEAAWLARPVLVQRRAGTWAASGG